MTDSELIDSIQQIRQRNNGNWMAILRLAFEIAPIRARKIFRDIVYCDGQIQRNSKLLARRKK